MAGYKTKLIGVTFEVMEAFRLGQTASKEKVKMTYILHKPHDKIYTVFYTGVRNVALRWAKKLLDEQTEYFRKGKCHRSDGPAVEYVKK